MKMKKLIKKMLKKAMDTDSRNSEDLINALKPFIDKHWCTRWLAYYNSITGEWLSKQCADTDCSFCKDRPKIHLDHCEGDHAD